MKITFSTFAVLVTYNNTNSLHENGHVFSGCLRWTLLLQRKCANLQDKECSSFKNSCHTEIHKPRHICRLRKWIPKNHVCWGLCSYELPLCDNPSVYNSCKDHEVRRRVPLKWSPPSFYSALGGAAGNARWGFLPPKHLGRRCKHTVCGKPDQGPTPCRSAERFFDFSLFVDMQIKKTEIIDNRFCDAELALNCGLTLGLCKETPWEQIVWSCLANSATHCLWWRLRWRPVRERKCNLTI